MKKKLRIVCNVLIMGMVAWAWALMLRQIGGWGLSRGGWGAMKYFTVLSNFLEGIAAAVWLASRLVKKGGEWTDRLKYVADVSVALTFLVVVLFLGPLFGYGSMFTKHNLFFHLLVPLASMAEFALLNETPMSVRDNALAVAPMLIYGVYYVGNASLNGIGAWPASNDWYGFLTWGWGVGVFIFIAIAGITFLTGLALRRINPKIASPKQGEAAIKP